MTPLLCRTAKRVADLLIATSTALASSSSSEKAIGGGTFATRSGVILRVRPSITDVTPMSLGGTVELLDNPKA